MSESLFSNAGLLFFITWSIVVATVTLAAFGRDLLRLNLPVDAPRKASSRDSGPAAAASK